MDVPETLKKLPRWVAWKKETREGKPTKIPVNPRTGENASTSEFTTWGTYEEARRRGGDLVGFVFGAGADLFGIDLDGCIDEHGEVAPWALEILARFRSYSEVSPSGNGIKIYAKGRFPGRGRKKEVADAPVNGKTPNIEVYPGDASRFFAFTGKRLPDAPAEIEDCQEELTKWIAEEFPERVRRFLPVPLSIPSDAAVELRASHYLAKVEPTVCGTSSCHDKTYRVACILVVDFNIAPDKAFPLLADWVARGEHPWSEKELWHKINSANANPNPRGGLLARSESNDVDLSQFMVPAPAPVLPAWPDDEPDDPSQLPSAIWRDIPGFLGELIEHNLATALYPQPELALAGHLALLSVLTGRKVCDDIGTRTNCYLLGLAPSGAGKEHARKLNKQVLVQIGAEKLAGPERIGSGAGMISVVQDTPAVLFQVDEIARLLKAMGDPKRAPHLYQIGSVFLQLYTSSDSIFVGDAYADISRIKRVNQPHVVAYGTAPSLGFWEALTAENVEEGLVGRFMVFEAHGDDGSGYVDVQETAPAPVPASILARARWLYELRASGGNLSEENPVPHVVPYSADARARIAQHGKDIAKKRKQEAAGRAAIWSRTGEKTRKLALLFACSRAIGLPDRIEIADAERAVRLSNWLTRKMLSKIHRHVSDNEQEAKCKRVLRILEKRMSRSDLCRKTQWLNRWERDAIIISLAESGQIIQQSVASDSGSQTTYLQATSTLLKAKDTG